MILTNTAYRLVIMGLISSFLFLYSCENDDNAVVEPSEVIADAGDDMQTEVGQEVVLDGSGSSATSGTLNYFLPEKSNLFVFIIISKMLMSYRFCVTSTLKTIIYESKRLDFQKGQVLSLNFSNQALRRTGSFLVEAKYEMKNMVYEKVIETRL